MAAAMARHTGGSATAYLIKREFTISSVLLGMNTFSVTVFPNVDHVFITALVVILDEVHRNSLRHRPSRVRNSRSRR
ncbi:unnamed protein product [Urochloa humidicola]